MRFRSASELGPEHVGRRVTVRRTLPEGGTGDVIGVLESIDDERLHVRNKHAVLVEIERRAVVASRVI